MTTKVIDGFDWFPSGASSTLRTALWGANGWFHRQSGFNSGGVPNVITGRFDFGKAVSIVATTGTLGSPFNQLVIPIDDLLTEGYTAFAFYYPSSNGNSHINCKSVIALYDGVNNQYQCSVAFRNNGVIEAWRGHPISGTKLANTPTGSYEDDRWMVVEIRWKVHDTAGEIEVRVNTVQKIDVVSSDTRGGTITTTFDSVGLSAHSEFGEGSQTAIFDDFYFNDINGTVNNDFLGNLRVKTQFMIADGYLNDFSIGGSAPASTNWQSVLNQNIDDTKYVYSPNVGDMDFYTPDPNLNAPYVRALQVRMSLRQDDATQRSARAVIRLSGVNYEDDVEHFTNQSYTFYFGIWELNPATGVSFTGAEVNAAEVGVKVES